MNDAPATTCASTADTAVTTATTASPHAWYRPGRHGSVRGYGDAFANRTAAQAWRDALPREQVGRGQCRRGIPVRGDAVLPSGQTVAGFCSAVRVGPPPAWVTDGGDRARDLWLAGQRVLALDRAFHLAHPELSCTTDRYFVAFTRVHGAEIAALAGGAFSSKRSAMLELRKRDAARAPYDRRHIASGRRAREFDPRLTERVKDVYLHPNKFHAADAHAEQARLAAELGVEALPLWRVEQIVTEIPAAVKARRRHGRGLFEAKFVPKATLDYSDVPAGDWLCLDGRVIDAEVARVLPDGSRKAVRPVVAATMDMRSTLLRLVPGRTENNVLILRGLREWEAEFGRALIVTSDWGKAYLRALKHLLDDLGIEHRQPPVKWPWAKRIESVFRVLKKHHDRWYRTFWGGSPAERSHVAARLVAKHLEQLPTEDEFYANLQVAVETINNTPRRALGGLSPQAVFDQNRGEIRRSTEGARNIAYRPTDGPLIVRQNGVRYNGVLYELEPEDLVALQGREVKIKPDIDLVGQIIVCDLKGKPICEAVEQRLLRAGVRDEARRDQMQRKARFRRRVKEYRAATDFLRETTTSQLLEAQRDFSAAQAAEERDRLPEPPEPDVKLVSADLECDAKRIERQRSRRKIAGAVKGAGHTDVPSGFDRLADRLDAARQQIVPTACSWDAPRADDVPDAEPGQDARDDPFERLSNVG